MKPEDICPYCSTFSCVAETNLALKCGTAQAVILEARAVAAESRLAAAEECLREINAKVGHFADMDVQDFPLALIPLVARRARAFLAGGETK